MGTVRRRKSVVDVEIAKGGKTINDLAVVLLLACEEACVLQHRDVARPKRLDRFPELPTIAESGIPHFESKAWFGLFAPGRTPPEIVARINAEVRDIFADPEFRDKFLDANQMEPLTGSPDQLAELLRAESLHWQNVIRQTGVTLN